MFRMAGSAEGDVTNEATFADALKARFGDSIMESEAEAETSPDADTESGGEGGPSPLPSSPPETPAPDDLPPAAEESTAATGWDDPTTIPEPDPEAPPALPFENDITPPADVDFNELFERHYGVKPSPSQMTSLLSLVDQLQQLNPSQQAMLNVVLSGQMPDEPPSRPQAPPQAAPITEFPLDELSDDARAVLEPIVVQQQQILARLQEQEQVTARAVNDAQEQQIVAGIQAASTDFVNQYSNVLSPTDLVLLETRIQQSGQFPFFMRQHNGNAAAAYRALIDTMAYSDPQIRDKIVNAAPAATTAADQAAQARQTKASALAAGGQAGNRVSPLGSNTPPGPPADRNGGRDWAINEISRATGLPRVS
jgi:hypothetical protein